MSSSLNVKCYIFWCAPCLGSLDCCITKGDDQINLAIHFYTTISSIEALNTEIYVLKERYRHHEDHYQSLINKNSDEISASKEKIIALFKTATEQADKEQAFQLIQKFIQKTVLFSLQQDAMNILYYSDPQVSIQSVVLERLKKLAEERHAGAEAELKTIQSKFDQLAKQQREMDRNREVERKKWEESMRLEREETARYYETQRIEEEQERKRREAAGLERQEAQQKEARLLAANPALAQLKAEYEKALKEQNEISAYLMQAAHNSHIATDAWHCTPNRYTDLGYDYEYYKARGLALDAQEGVANIAEKEKEAIKRTDQLFQQYLVEYARVLKAAASQHLQHVLAATGYQYGATMTRE